MRHAGSIVMLSLGGLFAAEAARAQEESTASADFDRAVFGFAGAITDVDMAKSATVFPIDYDGNYIIGGGYQFFPYALEGVRFGIEGGFAARFGEGFTGEVWGGGVLRYDSIRLTDSLFLSPAFTAGLSFVNAAQPGREQDQERADGGNARALFYLGPELNLSFSEGSDTEFFWRLHHRSGAGGTLGDMKGAMNANVFGVRYKF